MKKFTPNSEFTPPNWDALRPLTEAKRVRVIDYKEIGRCGAIATVEVDAWEEKTETKIIGSG